MFILANLRVGEFKISHIISYLGQIQDGGEIVYKCRGAEKTPVYSTFIYSHNIFFEVIMSEIMGLSSFTFIFIPAL